MKILNSRDVARALPDRRNVRLTQGLPFCKISALSSRREKPRANEGDRVNFIASPEKDQTLRAKLE